MNKLLLFSGGLNAYKTIRSNLQCKFEQRFTQRLDQHILFLCLEFRVERPLCQNLIYNVTNIST